MDNQDYGETICAKDFFSVPSFAMPKTFRNCLRFRYRIWRLKRRGVKECNVIYGCITRVRLTPDMTGKKILSYIEQYLRQLSGLDFSAWAMNTTHWLQMFSDISNKNQIRCLRMCFLISRVNTSP